MADKPPLLWLSFPTEVNACPACRSRRIVLLEPFKIPRDAKGRRVSYLTGCHECGLLFANPQPSPQDLERQYAPDGAWRHGREARAAKRVDRPAASRDPRDVVLEALARFVPIDAPPAGSRVLDFGCGDGKFLDRLQDRGWKTFGIEPSTDFAFSRHEQLREPPADGRFSLVILHHVLEHIPEPLTLLKQLAASLEVGGTLFVSIPSVDNLPQHQDLKYCIDGRHHIVAFSERCLSELLGRAGLSLAALLDDEGLDREITGGRPLRLRIVARRTDRPAPGSEPPLAPALLALRRYHAQTEGGLVLRALLPVRFRGALLDQSIERRARRRREERNAAAMKELNDGSR
jgi:SAM-dependent methyltransferase